MRIVIVGGGIAGLACARLHRAAGQDPLVLERMPEGHYQPRPFLLGFQGFPALEEIGVLQRVRAAGWDVAPGPDGAPVAIAVDVGRILAALGEGVPVAHGQRVVELRRADGRIAGVVAEDRGGRRPVPADLVVACDGAASPVRVMAGLRAERVPLAEATLTFMSPVVIDRSFHMTYLSDGGQMGLLGWPEGSAGWRTIDPISRERALAPGVAAFRRAFARLMPEAKAALAGVVSIDQIHYAEPAVLSCPRWWTPGVALVGDSAHFFGPETGVGAGLGLGDAHALATAVARHPDDPDEACRRYEEWRLPAVRPYEAADPARGRLRPRDVERPPEERWPPDA
jgi:2-polyprenyl-6-methoxyphenol hydroxylase-like FAD-dependent oxidoreductase